MKIKFLSIASISILALLMIQTEENKPRNFNNIIKIETDATEKIQYALPAKILKKPFFLNCGVSDEVKAVLVKYLNQDAALFELNSNNRWSIASLTKLMTAVLAIEKIGAEKEINLPAGRQGIKEEIYKVSDLIKAMMIISDNNAAEAISDEIGREKFVKLMNQKAKELFMTDTIFLNPSGLSFLNQSTVSDLAKLVNYIRANHREIFEISRQKETVITELKSGKTKKLISINFFAGKPDFLGGKTGFLEASGRNLISLFNKNGKSILIIILGADNAFKETENLLKCAGNI
ncbi:MAG: serine hydrolase [Patescibacteria group bacterium]